MKETLKMKRTLMRITAVVCAFLMAFSLVSFARADEAVRLVIWSYSDEFKNMLKNYYIVDHPDVDLYFEVYSSDVYVEKLDAVLTSSATAAGAPDLFVLDDAFAKRFINSDVTGNLEDLGITEDDTRNVYPMILETGKSTKTQEQKALSWQANPTVIIYRPGPMDEYLDAKSPEEFEVKIQDLDSFLDSANCIADKSGGSKQLVAGIDDLMVFRYSDEGSLLNGDSLSVSSEMVEFTEVLKGVKDSGSKEASWSEEWFDGMKGKRVLAYILPLWGLKNTMIPNCVENWDYENPDSEENIRNAKENGTYGDWRVAVCRPIRGNWGGSYIATNRAKVDQAGDRKKEAIRELISYMTLDEGFLLHYAEESGVFVSNMNVNQFMAADDTNEMDFLGGQNPYGALDETARELHRTKQSEYDDELQETWKSEVITPYLQDRKDLATAMADFTTAVLEAHPGWTLDTAEPIDLNALEKLILPEDTAEIQAGAFAGTDAEMIVVPDGITVIGSRAFADCPRLKCLSLPEGEITIADDILEGCSNVKILCLPDSPAEAWANAHGFGILVANE